MTTQRMKTDNEAFVLDRLAADTPRPQLYRELTQNALEAIRRRFESGDNTPGIVQWDVDWIGVRAKKYKLSVSDNGDGMSGDDMCRYLNSFAVQGANNNQMLTGNFGVGAKITALHHNPAGLAYLSWRDGRGNSVELHRDDTEKIYGLRMLHDKSGEPTYIRPLVDSGRPSIINNSGTKVVLFGNHSDEETWRRPDGIPGGQTNWLYKYLNGRYFRIPDNITIRVRNLKKDPSSWPENEPPASDSTFNFETIRGMKEILDGQVRNCPPDAIRRSGIVHLSTVDVHWWLFEDRSKVDNSINPRSLPPGHVGIIFQDEVYTIRTGASARKLMALFGILYGADSIIIYIEPRGGENVHSDTGRSRIFIDGADADSADLWSRWGEEFRGQMPADIEEFIERLLSRDTDSHRQERRERVLERLEKIRELLTPSRYRPSATGRLVATTNVTGGDQGEDESEHGAQDPPRRRGVGGRSADDYLAAIAEEIGERAEPIRPQIYPPDIRWISIASGLRTEGDLEDRAADIPGDVLKGPEIRLNEDFRGFSDLFNYFVREVGGDSEETLVKRVREVVKEWLETQVLEIVLAVRALEGNSFWPKYQLESALSPEALTTALMGRFFIIERVRRTLGAELGKARIRTEPA